MAPEIERITNTFLSAPVRVEIARQATASENIKQSVVMFAPKQKGREPSEKRQLLRYLIDLEGKNCTNAIVFCNRKTDVDICSKSLNKYGYQAAPIHGDLDQTKRTETLESFRDGDLRILVASDVAARGLDIPSVSHVFNFDVPIQAEDYVHRIGRTGRAGRDGTAIMICSKKDRKNFSNVEELLQKEIPRTNFADGASSFDEIENGDLKRKSDIGSIDESVTEYEKNKPKSTKNSKKYENSNRIVGLGEHTPSFLSQSFSDRLVS